ncbi:uncharacterized protein LOC143922323 [Arctopsyche grandis]|uniref:uncharacterized protein LOC143922323 n=1 Tax=Arctopsyche grandis TaxID=121162 RepID=UPI00406D6324
MSSVLRKKSTSINDKEEKKKIKVSEKSSSVDHEVKKKGVSKISENVLRKKSKDIESGVKVKAVPSTSRKIVSNSIKANNTVVHQRIKNESTPLKANHQVNTNVQNLTVKKRNPKAESKQPVAKQRTQNVSTKNRELSNDKMVSPKVQTSVTINSPKQKRKELPLNLSTQNSASPRDSNVQNSKLNGVIGKSLTNEKFDLALNNHSRYRTRTLDPEEVKVIDKLVPNIDYEVSQSKPNVKRNLIAQPKTFFVSLDEKEKSKVHKSKQETTKVSNCDKSDPPEPQDSGESLSYEDDFESYESDFESDDSTNGSHTSTSSRAEEVSSTSSNLDSTNNDLQIRAKLDDDKKFDSGNYELGELQKSAESKPLEKIIEVNNSSNLKCEPVPQPMTSLTDEGFDENSAGLSSSINNVSNSTKVNDSTKKTAFAQRAKDLQGLIVLDDVKYTLFEMFPMNYDTFIMIHGKSNMNQVTCQTNDDYIDQDVQTDSVSTDTKWTQNPIKFSKHLIVHNENAPNSNNNQNAKSKNMDMDYSALEVYVSQKLGCGSSTLFTHKEIRDKIHSAHRASFVKLTKFIHKAGRLVLNFFNERERFVEDKSANISADENKHTYKNEGNVVYEVIKKYPLKNIHFTDTNTVLTVHSAAKTDSVRLETLICLWMLRNGALEPLKILSTVGSVKCCAVSGGLSGLVVAGLSDGNISAWNLKEQDIWFESLDEAAANEDRPFRICSYHSGYDVCKVSSQKRHSWGASVEVLFSKSTLRGDSSFGNVSKNQQVYLLQEFGLLTTWIVVNKPPGYKNIADMDCYHTNWSTISLVKTNAVDLNSFIHTNLNDYNEGFMKRNATKLNDKIKGNIPKKEKVSIESKKGIVRAFTDDSDIDFDYAITGKQEKQLEDKNKNVSSSVINWESDEGSSVTCIETCPSNLPYFVVGCDSSNAIHLYADKSTRPLRNFYLDQSDTYLESNKKFTDRSDGRIVLLDLFNSDVLPKLYSNYANNKGNGDKYLLNGKVLSPMNDGHLNTHKYLMMLHLSNGEVQFHKLNRENFEMKFQSKEEELDILNTYFGLL